MLRWAGFRRQGSDELFKIDHKRLGASDTVAAAAKEIWTKVAAAFPVVGYSQARTCCARFYEIYAYTQPATGDHSDRLADRAEYGVLFFCILSSGFPFKTAVVNSRDSLAGATHTQQCSRGTTHACNASGAREVKQEAAIQSIAPGAGRTLCHRICITSNQGGGVGVGDPDPPRGCVCVRVVASFCVFASRGRRGQARGGTGLGSSWRWIGREGNTKNESVRCNPDSAQAQTRQYNKA
ncbi:unnamed protein product, partial [Ectocarpus sp. 8 AP-2014]